MSDILRDPLWQFAGFVVSGIAIVIAVWIAWLQRRIRRLTYRMRTSQLVSVDAQIHDRIQIMYEGQPTEDVRLTELTLRSAGNMPITPADFVKPVVCDFGKGARVLTAELLTTEPDYLDAKIRWHGDGSGYADISRVELEPLLLNAGDMLTIRCLVTQSAEFDVIARISGVKSVEREQPKRNWKPFTIGFVVGVLPSVVYFVLRNVGPWWLSAAAASIFALFVLIIILFQLKPEHRAA